MIFFLQLFENQRKGDKIFWARLCRIFTDNKQLRVFTAKATDKKNSWQIHLLYLNEITNQYKLYHRINTKCDVDFEQILFTFIPFYFLIFFYNPDEVSGRIKIVLFTYSIKCWLNKIYFTIE